jgi:hypothetical protein
MSSILEGGMVHQIGIAKLMRLSLRKAANVFVLGAAK